MPESTTRRRPGAPRQPYRKYLWLRDHPRREELARRVASVAAELNPRGESAAPMTAAELASFNLTVDQRNQVRADALGVRARLAKQSWRRIAVLAKPERSHELWRKIVKLYTEFHDDLFRPG